MRPMSKATTTRKVDYFRLPRPLWRKLKKCLPKKRNKASRGGRPSASERAVINGIRYVLWTGSQWKAVHRDWFGVSASVIHERFQRWRRMGIFEKLMKRMVEYYAKESSGIGWRWQAMDSKNSPAPLGGQSGAPLSVVLTGANRHDKVAAIDLIVSMSVKRPAHKEQHLCADKAYDASEVREFASSEGYTTHIKVNPRKKDSTESSDQSSQETDSHGEPHPARRWVVERTISWLLKRRSLRTRWSKKAENWLALIQLACAHVLLNLAVLG